ncbi:Asp23/Gls24 family envelope stress response protein [Nocardiopsis flavescens]|uniref:Asp23/Gls24 family envelope stress response protein n=1 Tax=Nocardiopsis flavescens TaxID=758803 RepID=UPI0036674F54
MSDTRTEAAVPGAREADRRGGAQSTGAQSAGTRGDGDQGATGGGSTHIADGVVAKIAGMAAREIGGVHTMGGGAARAMGAVKDAVTGGGDRGSVARGVSVEVGERQAAVDIDLVVEYGTAIQDLAAAVRRNVAGAIEKMTGLEVTEINVRVDDIHLPDEDDGDDGDADAAPRVR